jgi:hypothetical protein
MPASAGGLSRVSRGGRTRTCNPRFWRRAARRLLRREPLSSIVRGPAPSSLGRLRWARIRAQTATCRTRAASSQAPACHRLQGAVADLQVEARRIPTVGASGNRQPKATDEATTRRNRYDESGWPVRRLAALPMPGGAGIKSPVRSERLRLDRMTETCCNDHDSCLQQVATKCVRRRHTRTPFRTRASCPRERWNASVSGAMRGVPDLRTRRPTRVEPGSPRARRATR